METSTILAIGVYLLGAAVGVFYPWVRKWLVDGTAFDWRKIAGKAVATLLGIVLVPTFVEIVEAVGNMGLLAVFFAGLAATFVGHEAQSTPAAIEAARNGE